MKERASTYTSQDLEYEKKNRNGRFLFYISTSDEMHYSEENDMFFMDHRPSDKIITRIVIKSITLTGHSIPF